MLVIMALCVGDKMCFQLWGHVKLEDLTNKPRYRRFGRDILPVLALQGMGLGNKERTHSLRAFEPL